jgi:hypothetical protein
LTSEIPIAKGTKVKREKPSVWGDLESKEETTFVIRIESEEVPEAELVEESPSNKAK